MATLTLLNSGAQRKARLYQHGPSTVPTVGDLIAKLYVNNHAPAVTDTISAFTLATAGSFPGYTDTTLVGANYTGSVSAGVADYTYPAFTITFTAGAMSPGTIYGVVIVDPDGNAVEAGLLDVPFPVPAGGGSLTLNLEFKNQQCA